MVNCLSCLKSINHFHTSFNNMGVMEVYCSGCYFKIFVDNKPHMSMSQGVTLDLPVCECGSKTPVGQNHSSWCKLFKREF
jgi:hypothetical protein